MKHYNCYYLLIVHDGLIAVINCFNSGYEDVTILVVSVKECVKPSTQREKVL